MEAQPEVPNFLPTFAHRYVASVTSDAIFHVRARAMDDARPSRDGRAALNRLLCINDPKRNSGNRTVASSSSKQKSKASSSEHPEPSEPLDDMWTKDDIRTSTGFAVRRNENRMLILTVAHIIRPVYAHRAVITNACEDLNTAFRFDVMCIHQERDLLSIAEADQDIGAMRRTFTNARIVAIDSELDLLALEVADDEIWIFDEATKECSPCVRHHGLLPIDEMAAADSEDVLLQSWPELRSDSTYWAKSSYPERRYNSLTSTNPYGYGMRLLELPGVQCPNGCSGSPVINGRLRAVGLLHGVLGKYGYAVSSADIRNFLQRYHLVSNDCCYVPIILDFRQNFNLNMFLLFQL
jgi:hypothetical protein